MSVAIREKVGDSLRVHSGRKQLAVAPGRSRVVAVIPGDGQVSALWDFPVNGGSALTGFTLVVRNAATDAVLQTIPLAANTAQQTVTGLVNGTPVYVTVTATNAVGSTVSLHSATVTPAGAPPVKPSVADTGVPMGLAGDPRTPEPLTPFPAGRIVNRTTSTGIPYRQVTLNAPETFDHIDFSDIQIVVQADDVVFDHCNFHYENTDAGAFTSGVSCGNIHRPKFRYCTADGRTLDPYTPIKAWISTSGTSAGNAQYDREIYRCNVNHFNDGLTWSNVDGDHCHWNYVHDLSTVKSGGWVKGTVLTVLAGAGSLAAGAYYFNVHALTHKANTSLVFETIPNLDPPIVTVAANGAIKVDWTAFTPSVASGRVLDGYRVYISQNPASFTDYLDVAPGTTTATYTGQALTPKTDNRPEDVSGYLHPDATQMGPGFGRNILLEFNNLESIDETNTPVGSIFQLGSFSPALQVLGPFTARSNWLDGSATSIVTGGGGTGAPNWSTTGLTFDANRIGRRFTGAVRQTAFKNDVNHTWTSNVYDTSGPSKNGTGPDVSEGQLVV